MYVLCVLLWCSCIKTQLKTYDGVTPIDRCTEHNRPNIRMNSTRRTNKQPTQLCIL